MAKSTERKRHIEARKAADRKAANEYAKKLAATQAKRKER